MRAQDRIEGREPIDTGEDDYAVVDEMQIGRIYREPIHGEMKWRWFLQTVPTPPPKGGSEAAQCPAITLVDVSLQSRR